MRKRPQGTKTTKAAKEQKVEEEYDFSIIKDALKTWASGYAAANQALLEAAREESKNLNRSREKKLELKEKAGDFEELRLLFSGSNEVSLCYCEALQVKKLKKVQTSFDVDEATISFDPH